MIAARRRPGSPHQSIIEPAFGSAAFCAGCHEFSFPVLDERGRLVRYTEEPMQATVSQFFASEASSALECVDCHGSPAGHAFPGSHDPAMVARAVDLQLCRDRGSLAAVLTNTGAAHHVPTGGVHRRMVLRAWHPRAPERLIEGVIGRRFEALAGGGKETISDTTIAPGESFRLTVPLRDLKRAEGDAAVNLELRYIYALDERAELAGAPASRRILHRRIDPADLSTCGG